MKKRAAKKPGKRAPRRKVELLKWTMAAASVEFDIHKDTLSKRIRSGGIEPDKAGKFTTRQICAAVFGDIDGERLRKTREEADLLALKKSVLQRDLIPTADVQKVWLGVITMLRQKILFLGDVTTEQKHEILRDLQSIPVAEYFRHDQPESDPDSDSNAAPGT